MQKPDGRPGGTDHEHTPPVDRRSPLGTRQPGAAVARSTDEAEARAARHRLHERGIVPIDPDPQIAVMLCPDEVVVAFRRDVMLDRRQPVPAGRLSPGGDLYVTSRRLVHIGRDRIAYDLDQIREAVVVGDTLQLMLEGGLGVSIATPDPRLLRVEISAARAAARADRGG